MIVAQPGVTTDDYHDRFATPILRRMVQGDDKKIRSSLTVQGVKGTISVEDLSLMMQKRCGAKQSGIDASSRITPIPFEKCRAGTRD